MTPTADNWPQPIAAPRAAVKVRRRWWQFSLRMLLVLVGICGVGCCWLFVRLREAQQQRAVVADLKRVGAQVIYDYEIDADGNYAPGGKPSGSAWLRNLLGADFFDSVVRINAHGGLNQPFGDQETTWFLACPHLRYLELYNGWITDAGLARLSEASNLRELEIGGLITDVGLAHICRCTQIKKLAIRNTKVTSAGLAKLGTMANLAELRLPEKQSTDSVLAALVGLTNLKRLDLEGSHVTDAGMVFVARLKELERLDLWQTAITDQGLKQLVGLGALRRVSLPDHITDTGLESVAAWSRLDTLFLPSQHIGDDGLQHLADCKELRYLIVDSARVTDEGLKYLASLRKLTALMLNSPKITDAGLVSLELMTSLESLTLSNAKITDDGAKRLLHVLPKTSIYPYGTRGESPLD